MAHLDSALVQQVLDIPQRERKAHLDHHRQPHDFGAVLKVAKGAALGHQASLGSAQGLLIAFPLTVPSGQVLKYRKGLRWVIGRP
jgi:hypothetical protein